MADFLLYWKSFWREGENNVIDRDFRWHTKQEGSWRSFETGDSLWTVASGGDEASDEWRLVDRIVVKEKFTNFDYDWPFGVIGDFTQSEAYQIDAQPNLTPLLQQLEFASGKRLTKNGRAIGNALQAHRRLTQSDGRLLEEYARGLVRIAVASATLDSAIGVSEKDFAPRLTQTGAGFGDPESNQRVERAAIAAVTEWYEDDGWVVQSVEADKCGYDLLCNRTIQENHVEVKGVKGEIVAFIITAGEVRRAENDPDFVLCVVTSALDTYPMLHFYDSDTFTSDFDLSPLAYRATPRRTIE